MNNTIDSETAAAQEIKESRRLLVTSSPHFRCGTTTAEIMQDVLIALVPAAIISIVYFGWRSAMLIAVCLISCVLFEWLSRKVMKRKNTISDYSACVTGLLLALNLPPTLNPIYAVFGSAVAIIVVKQMFGGIGMNFANPAIAARIVLMTSFPTAMSTWARPFFYLNSVEELDGITTATPLAIGFEGAGTQFTALELLFGHQGGCLGETCAVALILGGLYLILRGVIKPTIPVCYIGTVAVLSFLYGLTMGFPEALDYTVYQLLSGGLMLGAIFMATDYSTSPINDKGKIIYAVGCGLFTVLIRTFSNLPEGVSFSILLMNILVPHIEKLTTSKPFGEEKEAAE